MIAEGLKIVPIAHANDLNVGSTQVTDSINMSGYHRATFAIQFHTLGGATATLKVYSGATAASLDSALTFRYAWGGAAQGTATAGSATSCDVLAAWGTSADLSLTHTTYSDFMLVIEVDASDMDVANEEEWLTIETTDPTGATGLYTAFAILTPRYAANRSVTALA
jgi:hypothetical protein